MRAILSIALALAAPAHAALSEQDLAQAVARPPAGVRLPGALVFSDERDRRRTLAEVALGRPLVLIFADYSCRHICGPGLALTAAALAQAGLAPGRDYRLAVIGLDPRDGPDEARAMAARLGDGPVRAATAVLRGTPAAVVAAEHALGYHAVYDARTDQFAHDASVYVFAKDGRLAALLPEIGLRADTLRAAVIGGATTASLGERVARLCYGLGAAHGYYGAAIAAALRAAGVAMLIASALLVLRLRRKHSA